MEKKFDQADKDLKALRNRMGTKIDRLLYTLMCGPTGLVLKGGLDFYLKEKRGRSTLPTRSVDACRLFHGQA